MLLGLKMDKENINYLGTYSKKIMEEKGYLSLLMVCFSLSGGSHLILETEKEYK